MICDLTGRSKQIGRVTVYEFVQPNSAGKKLGGGIDKPELLRNLHKSEIGWGTIIYGSQILKDILCGENCIIAYSTIDCKLTLCAHTSIINCSIFNLFNAPARFSKPIILANKAFYAVSKYDNTLEDDFTEVYRNGTELLFADSGLRIDCFQTDGEHNHDLLFQVDQGKNYATAPHSNPWLSKLLENKGGIQQQIINEAAKRGIKLKP